MKPLAPLLLLLIACVQPLRGQAQGVVRENVAEGISVTEFRAEPRNPGFGEQFDLYLTLRVAPGFVAYLPDSMAVADAVEGAGRGSWIEIAGPADSTEVRVVYPMISYRAGVQELPAMELWVRPAAAAPASPSPAAAVAVRRATPADRLTEDERHLIRIGGISFMDYAPLADSTALLVPRPPADIVGEDWSVWLLLAGGLVSIVGIGGATALGPRLWQATIGRVAARLQRKTPRQEALLELERIRALGWHRNGRVDDFYASSTGALRRFASQIEPAWTEGLTSSELLEKLVERWGGARSTALEQTVAMAERVKFGIDRPEADTAERDWNTIRDWIRGAPLD